jgi:tellurite methyltransferase
MTSSRQEASRDIHPAEAEQMVAAGQLQVLDVRSPAEFSQAGHIPDALLLPVDLVAAAPATLQRDERPLLVVCEHGVRSAHAVRFLTDAGFTNLLNMSGGMSCWGGPRSHEAAAPKTFLGPSSWILANGDLLPWGGRALDVACGRGRHALILAVAGFTVDAVDRDLEQTGSLAATAQRLSLALSIRSVDLEAAGQVDLGQELYDLVVVTRYLHRPLFPSLKAALKPGGLLLYETFTTLQAASGHPSNPDYLLEEGELIRLVSPLDIVRQREGEFDGAQVSAVAALKPGGSEGS